MKRIHVAWAVAASLMLVAGLAFGRYLPTMTGNEDSRPQFALLLYEDAGYQAAAAGEDRVAEYSAWARALGERGHLVEGAKLDMEGVTLSSAAQVPASIQDERTVRGYFVIRAADRAEAQRIARECPHLIHGGTIELRRIS